MPNSQQHSRPAVKIIPPDGLAALRDEWAALWRRCPAATPFGAPEWVLPWARHYAPGRCGAVALRLAGRLAALVPVFCWEDAMLLAGTGPSDYGEALLEPGHEGAASALLTALPDVPCGAFERIDLRQLPPDSPFLDARAPDGWTEERRSDEPCHVAPLHGEDGLGAASRRRRSGWRYAMRRLGREAGAVELVPTGEAAAATADLVRLHGLRWRDRGEPGVLADPLLRGLLTDTAPELARSDLLRLYRLRIGGEVVAVLMALAGRRAHHYYLSGFDPAHARLSPSATLVGAAMAQAHGEGVPAFDFLRGAEPYKARWGACEHATHRRILTPG